MKTKPAIVMMMMMFMSMRHMKRYCQNRM